MGGLFNKTSTSTTTPDIPDFVWNFLESALGRYGAFANQAWNLFNQGGEGEGGYTYNPTVGDPAPGGTITSSLNPNFYDQNTGEWIAGDDQKPSIKDLIQQEGMTPEEAQEFLDNWGQDVDPKQYMTIVDADGNPVGTYTDMEQQVNDFWEEHPRPVVGATPEELEAARRAGTLDQLPEEYSQGLALLQQLMGLDPNEELGRELLLRGVSQSQESELPEWARALREAGAQRIDVSNLTEGQTFNELESVFNQAISPMIDSALAGSSLGRSPTVAAAAKASAFAPMVGNLINTAVGAEEGNRAAEMQGISGGAGILSEDLNRALNWLQTASGGLFNLGAQAKERIAQAAQGYFGTGAEKQAARGSSINALAQLGQVFRGYNQEAAESPWRDWFRRAAAFESTLGGPMGFIPSMFGATTMSQKKDK